MEEPSGPVAVGVESSHDGDGSGAAGSGQSYP